MPTRLRAPRLESGGDLDYTAVDFQRVRRLIRGRVGISLHPHKEEMVYSRLARRVRALGLGSFRTYLNMLERGGKPEWEHFTNSLTTNLTSFYREPHHFEVLGRSLRRWSAQRTLRLWCAGCASGEEAYSIAMTLVEALGTWTPPATILASDVDTVALAKAERGLYSVEHLARLTARRRQKYFHITPNAGGAHADVRPQLRKLVTFRHMNLLASDWTMGASFDAIFCRNVLIYFDRSTQRGVVERFRSVLHPDGLLFLGHAEGICHSADLFRRLGTTVYAPVASTPAASSKLGPGAMRMRLE